MSVDQATVRRIAHLSRIAVAEDELPHLQSLQDAFTYIRKKAKDVPEGEWIVLRFAFPTRLKEARFPTRAELDEAAPKHPVLYHAGMTHRRDGDIEVGPVSR